MNRHIPDFKDRKLKRRKIIELERKGVVFVDKNNVYIEQNVKIGAGTIVYPNVYIYGRTVIGRDCVIRENTTIAKAFIGYGCELGSNALIEDSKVYAHCRIGFSTQVRRSIIGRGTNAIHFCYIGDARIGHDCNIGAGTVFCNFDGKAKHPTALGNHVFIGSGTMLVAPLTMGDWSATGANTTLPKGTYGERTLYFVKRGKLTERSNSLAPKRKNKSPRQ